jgi:sulfate transport system substrate-binding protein
VQAFVKDLYAHVPVLDTGARGSTTTFVQRGLGDVLLAWENEAFLALKEFGPDQFEIVDPSISIKAEPPVTLVDGNADRKGTRKVAEAYLEYLYSDEGQKIAAANFYRPVNQAAADPEDLKRFADLKLVTIDDPLFGGWAKAQPKFFGDGGIFDQIYTAK